MDESAALVVEGDGSGRISATDPAGSVWLVRGGYAETRVVGKPLALRRVEVNGIGAGSVIHLPGGGG